MSLTQASSEKSLREAFATVSPQMEIDPYDYVDLGESEMTDPYPYILTDLVVATEENHAYAKGQLGTVVEFYDGYPVVLFDVERLAEVFDYDEIEPYKFPQEEEPEPSAAMAWDDMVQILDEVSSRAEYNHPAADAVEHPAHYNNGGIECIDYLKDNMSWEGYTGYLEGNCKKYLHRWRYKAKPLEDLKKARWYLDRLISELEGPDEP